MPHLSNAAGTARATLHRLVRLRWFLLGGGFAAVFAVPALLDVPLPTLPLLLCLGVLAGFNVLARRRLHIGETLAPQALALQIGVDLVALGALLFLSGGAANPLVSLLLLPVAAAALTLPPPWAIAIAASAVALYSLLAVSYLPLHVADAERAARLHLSGMWLTFVVSVVLVTWLILRMTASIRARDAALAAAREQALRDERVVALGALAAGAAHELGTPLATMAVIAGELECEPGLSADARTDVTLLRRQISACKDIVTGLAERAGAARLEGARAVAGDAWLADVLAVWHAARPDAACTFTVAGSGPAPKIVVDATLDQAVANLLNNATEAGGGEVAMHLDWSAGRLSLDILDHGSGFPAQVLAQAGHAPLPSGSGGAGIGLLLAHAAVARLGGILSLSNRPEGGARARMELPLAAPPAHST
jgi:two-component system sensor histidine kinase RegB